MGSSTDSDVMNSVSMMETVDPERLMLYRSVIHHTLQNITSEITIDEFTLLFQELPSLKNKYRIINNFYDILTKYVHDTVCDKVEEHIREDNLQEKFSQLEELIQKNSDNVKSDVWRPSRDVQRNLRSYTMQEKIQFKEELKKMIASKEAAIIKLKFDVNNFRNRTKEIEKRINTAVHSLDAIHESNNRLQNECRLVKKLTRCIIEE